MEVWAVDEQRHAGHCWHQFQSSRWQLAAFEQFLLRTLRTFALRPREA
jgi:hypothetical protein